MGLWCYLIHSLKQIRRHTTYSQGTCPTKGVGFYLPTTMPPLFLQCQSWMEQTQQSEKNKKRWPGFKLKLALTSKEQVSTVPPHHQCWFDQLVYTLSVLVLIPSPRQTPVSDSCLRWIHPITVTNTLCDLLWFCLPLGGWNVLREFQVHSFDLRNTLTRLHSQFGVSLFFKVDVVPDPNSAQDFVIQVSRVWMEWRLLFVYQGQAEYC